MDRGFVSWFRYTTARVHVPAHRVPHWASKAHTALFPQYCPSTLCFGIPRHRSAYIHVFENLIAKHRAAAGRVCTRSRGHSRPDSLMCLDECAEVHWDAFAAAAAASARMTRSGASAIGAVESQDNKQGALAGIRRLRGVGPGALAFNPRR